MAKKKSKKLDFESMGELSHNPFAALGQSLGITPDDSPRVEETPKAATARRAMLMVRMEKRSKGKVVTRIYHLEENPGQWLKKLKQKLGSGGALVDGALEIQGDHRDKIVTFFEEEGFRVRRGN